MTFKILWAVDAFIALIALYFFFIGIADGSVSSFNAGIWFILLVVLAVIVGGSIWLKSTGRNRSAIVLLLILAVPGIIGGLFLLAVLITNPRWN